MPERVLRISEVMQRTSLGRTSIWRLERAGQFPKRRQIAAGLTGFLEREVDEWIASRPVAAAREAE